ncbi:T9SS C-terminal target domain-containing protein, partial [Bacteroidetes/Chlorobi group bacterium ChocPot_Mid]
VYFDTLIISNQSPILFLKDIDISSMLNLELGEYSWVGFTSSTGNAHEKHEILNWNFCPNPSDVILSTEDNEINSEELLVIPNPISNFATFKFNNSDNELIELKIFNMLGCEIKTLRERNNIIIWNCSDSNGIKVLNGLYFFTIKIGNHIKSGKIIVE